MGVNKVRKVCLRDHEQQANILHQSFCSESQRQVQKSDASKLLQCDKAAKHVEDPRCLLLLLWVILEITCSKTFQRVTSTTPSATLACARGRKLGTNQTLASDRHSRARRKTTRGNNHGTVALSKLTMVRSHLKQLFKF